MAISKGPLKFTGRLGELVFYYMGNEIYVRAVFAGQRKRVMKDKRYELFRLYGTFFSQSSKIGSFIFRALGLKNEKKLYNKMVGEAQKFFKHTNLNGEQVMEVMMEKYMNGFEVEVPKENEENGKTYGLLLAKRDKEEKKSGEVVMEEGYFVNEAGEIDGMERMADGVSGDEDVKENVEEKVAVIRHQESPVMEKRSRIMKRDSKIKWKVMDVLDSGDAESQLGTVGEAEELISEGLNSGTGSGIVYA